jgi:CTD kinase subunit beta
LLDLLDLYTNHRPNSAIGSFYPLETYINIRIALNQEASAAGISRFAQYAFETPPQATNGTSKPRNGVDPKSPVTPMTPGTLSPGSGPTSAIGVRGQNGTVRFMLDPARARFEKVEYDKYHKMEEEEYEVEVLNEPERRRVR